MKRLLLAGAAAGMLVACNLPASTAGTTRFGVVIAHAPHSWPSVTVDSTAAPAWPVGQAVANWGLPMRYGGCVSWAPCIRITDVPTLPLQGRAFELGLTVQYITTGRPLYETIQLADYPVQSYAGRLETVCHELGHAFGIGHDYTGGCMQPTVDGNHPYPSAPELALLHQLYGTE